MSSILLVIIGFLLLFLGGELLVRGSVALAIRMKISTLVIGMTVVSFATSSPEIFVSIKALYQGSSDIIFGNVIGSNIANIALVLALTALIFKVNISELTMKVNYPALMLSSVLLGIVFYFFNGIPQFFGYVFLVGVILFSYLLIKKSRSNYSESIHEDSDLINATRDFSLFKMILFLFLGVLTLKYGADKLVEGTVLIAQSLGVSERIIAVSVVAVGTSIPELATSLIAAFKKEDSLAIGNLIGSNIFNILVVLGVVSAIRAVNIDDTAIFTFDYILMLGITLVLGLFVYLNSTKIISRKEGAVLLILYILYMYKTISLV